MKTEKLQLMKGGTILKASLHTEVNLPEKCNQLQIIELTREVSLCLLTGISGKQYIIYSNHSDYIFEASTDRVCIDKSCEFKRAFNELKLIRYPEAMQPILELLWATNWFEEIPRKAKLFFTVDTAKKKVSTQFEYVVKENDEEKEKKYSINISANSIILSLHQPDLKRYINVLEISNKGADTDIQLLIKAIKSPYRLRIWDRDPSYKNWNFIRVVLSRISYDTQRTNLFHYNQIGNEKCTLNEALKKNGLKRQDLNELLNVYHNTAFQKDSLLDTESIVYYYVSNDQKHLLAIKNKTLITMLLDTIEEKKMPISTVSKNLGIKTEITRKLAKYYFPERYKEMENKGLL